MEIAVKNFEKGVADADAAMDNVEWMIKELDKAALSPDDNTVLQVLKSTRQIKNSYNQLVKDMEQIKIQQRDVIAKQQNELNSFRDRIALLKKIIDEKNKNM